MAPWAADSSTADQVEAGASSRVLNVTSRSDVLITVDELPDALASGAQLLDVRWNLGEQPGTGFGRYLQGHLPGARFLDLEAVLTGPSTDPTLGRHPLPDAVQLGVGLGLLGIDPARQLIVYDEPGSYAAGRAWWVLRWAGLDARVLDGGLRAWLAAGRELETDEPDIVPVAPLVLTTGHLPTLDADGVAGFEGVLIDVRAPERFRGDLEPLDPRAGHIPGAVNRPVVGFWDADGLLPPAEELTAMFPELAPMVPEPDEGSVDGLRQAQPSSASPQPAPGIAVYCGSGVSAAQVVLALASLGVDAALYPPSWSGWSNDPSRPVAIGVA
jgi:thiosulfate/3-mercaptopyruvate sulfurtransferase